MPEEMRFLLRAGGYGLGVGAAYWFLSGEPAGTILMLGFGAAAMALLVIAWWTRRRRGERLSGPAWRWLLLPPSTENGGFTDEEARLPGSSLAPLTLGLGLSLLALTLVFGPWLAVGAVIPILLGVREWVRAAGAEYAAIERDTERGSRASAGPSARTS